MKSHTELILEFMTESGISQREMARRLQVTAATLSRWLSNDHGISRKHQRRIELVCAGSMAFDVTRKLVARIRQLSEAEQWELYDYLVRREALSTVPGVGVTSFVQVFDK